MDEAHDPTTGSPDSVAATMRRHGIRPKKSWGQNFLHDPRVAARITDAAVASGIPTIIEIGAGFGNLTRYLASRAQRIIAVERDRQLCALLRDQLAGADDDIASKVEVVEGNALTYDFSQFEAPVIVVGNLPYHISSQVIFRLIDHRDRVAAAIVMIQKELADRLVARPGSRTYGAASVMCQQYALPRSLFGVGRGAFIPPPRVDSTVIEFRMRSVPQCDVEPVAFRRVVRAAFSNRRKMLLKALSGSFPHDAARKALAKSTIDPAVRAESLSVEDFARLTHALFEQIR